MNRSGLLFALICLALALPMFAYERHLSANSVREAYFLGSAKDNRTSIFLSAYTHTLPRPKRGPDVSTIGIETPYAQVVRRSATALNYSAQDAQQEFFGKAAVFTVRVEIHLTPTYIAFPGASFGSPTPITDEFWRGFKFHLIEEGKKISPSSRDVQPLYSGGDDAEIVSGAMVELQYDAREVTSGSAVVRVLTPDGQDVETQFNLGILR